MNLVALIGNVATDPEFRLLDSGKQVATFRLAVSRAVGDGADFVTVIAWNRDAEIIRDYAAKGRRLSIEGRLHHSTWQTTGKKPENRSKVEVIAHRIHLLKRGA